MRYGGTGCKSTRAGRWGSVLYSTVLYLRDVVSLARWEYAKPTKQVERHIVTGLRDCTVARKSPVAERTAQTPSPLVRSASTNSLVRADLHTRNQRSQTSRHRNDSIRTQAPSAPRPLVRRGEGGILKVRQTGRTDRRRGGKGARTADCGRAEEVVSVEEGKGEVFNLRKPRRSSPLHLRGLHPHHPLSIAHRSSPSLIPVSRDMRSSPPISDRSPYPAARRGSRKKPPKKACPQKYHAFFSL